jgi:hypothetical protein
MGKSKDKGRKEKKKPKKEKKPKQPQVLPPSPLSGNKE